jgi:NAD(P)-dependent dehydrogenase (short-subunit alcohol dehydrogenase family)
VTAARSREEALVERRVLVTGGNSGIGLATTLHLARAGFTVVASVRDPEKATVVRREASAAGVAEQVGTVVFDVADEATYQDLVPGLDLWGLVNNAGWTDLGAVDDVTVDSGRELFETLVFGPMRLAQLAVPAMRRRGEGRIVNVTSAAAHLTGPLLGWYGAAKHALAALTDSLRPEVAGWGIAVVAVEPGAIGTRLWDRAQSELGRRAPASATPRTYGRGIAVIRRLHPHMPGPELVAAAVGDALQSGVPRPAYPVGWDATVLPALGRLLPTRTRDRVLRTILDL